MPNSPGGAGPERGTGTTGPESGRPEMRGPEMGGGGQMDAATAEAGLVRRQMRQIGTALHDLCQPLTTLQCVLEMAELVGTEEAHRAAVEAAISECARLTAAVGSMREMLRAGMLEQ